MRSTLYNRVKEIRAVNSTAVSTNTNTDGASIGLDQSGADFRDVLFIVSAGAVTDGTYTAVPQESANGSTGWTDVPADRLLGSAALTAANAVGAVGMVTQPNLAPFVRLRVTSTGVTTGGSISAVALLGSGDRVPVRRP